MLQLLEQRRIYIIVVVELVRCKECNDLGYIIVTISVDGDQEMEECMCQGFSEMLDFYETHGIEDMEESEVERLRKQVIRYYDATQHCVDCKFNYEKLAHEDENCVLNCVFCVEEAI